MPVASWYHCGELSPINLQLLARKLRRVPQITLEVEITYQTGLKARPGRNIVNECTDGWLAPTPAVPVSYVL